MMDHQFIFRSSYKTAMGNKRISSKYISSSPYNQVVNHGAELIALVFFTF